MKARHLGRVVTSAAAAVAGSGDGGLLMRSPPPGFVPGLRHPDAVVAPIRAWAGAPGPWEADWAQPMRQHASGSSENVNPPSLALNATPVSSVRLGKVL